MFLSSWKQKYEYDGWVPKITQIKKNSQSNKLTFLEKHDCYKVSKFLQTENPFIHQADLNIIMYKISLKNDKFPKLDFVKKAISHWVVTSEVCIQ